MNRLVQRRWKLMKELEALRPRDAEGLHRLVRMLVGVRVPRQVQVPGNAAPFDYLAHAFFEGGDCVVWACRGGGKTFLGAVATMLDLIYKPGIQIRILSGSLEQGGRMFGQLRGLFDRPALAPLVAPGPRRRRLALVNRSACVLLASSQASVRGNHVQKMRVDEADGLSASIWDAAQFTTREAVCGPVRVRGSVEALSTVHRSFGQMSRILRQPSGPLLRWSAMEVIARCPADRPCEGCPLWSHCLGRAKQAEGYVSVDEMIARYRRLNGDGSGPCSDTWLSEMMCLRPRRDLQVFERFDAKPGGRHVMAGGSRVEERGEAEETRAAASPRRAFVVGGMDFGMRNPLVMLWARLWPREDGDLERTVVEVFDEHHVKGLTIEAHLRLIEGRGWPRPMWLGCDPSGTARNSQTGLSDIEVLRRAGYTVRHQRVGLPIGLRIIRRRLDQATLRIAPQCSQLIRALCEYHYPEDRPHSEQPAKDGPDHAVDALRYLLVNLELSRAGAMRRRGYL